MNHAYQSFTILFLIVVRYRNLLTFDDVHRLAQELYTLKVRILDPSCQYRLNRCCHLSLFFNRVPSR